MSTLRGAANDVTGWFGLLAQLGFDTSAQDLKVSKEAAEFAENPSLDEAADVFISLLGSCRTHGWSQEDLAAAVHSKMAVNRQRKWIQLDDGTYQHV